MPYLQRPVWSEWTWRQAAWLPIPLLSVAILLLARFDVQERLYPPALIPLLNGLFKFAVYSLIAILAGRSFSLKGSPSILLLGAGMLVFGLSSGLAGFTWRFDAGNMGSVVSSLGVLAAGLCHLGSALVCGLPPVTGTNRRLLLAAAFVLGAVFVAASAEAGAREWLPPFAAPSGYPAIRQCAMGLAAGLFGVASLLFGFKYERDRSLFVFWYALGLGLTSLGLLAMTMQRLPDDLMSWTGRFAQYLGGLYILLALIHVLRKNRGWDIPLDAALRESEARYRALVDLVPDAVLVIQENVLAYGNEAAFRLLGVRDEAALLARSPVAFLSPEDRARLPGLMRDFLARSISPICEVHVLRPDESVVPVEARLARIEWKGREAVLVAARDVTERLRIESAMKESESRYKGLYDNMRQAKRETEEAAAALARSNRELEQFASVTSHDLKEPLRMVTAFLSLLNERLDGCLDAQSEEYIKIAMTSGMRMQELIDDLLVYSCAGREASRSVVPAAEAAALAVRNLEVSIKQSGAAVRVGALPVVQANPGELAQVFQNLISNAIKFRGVATPDIAVGAERDGADWRFQVRDNGIGIEPAYQSRLFKIFNRLHTTDDYPGTGIGLAVCKKIVERQGGRIWVESAPGRGSAFFFTLPAPAEEES